MKKTVKTLVIIAAVAMSLASCKKEAISPAGNTVKVSFSAAIDQISKVTLEADAEDAVFTPGWVNGDQITVTYSGPATGNATATWDGEKFTAEVAQEVAEAVGDWSYSVAYGTELGESFTQDGDAFNGAYDMMTGSISVTGSKFLQDDGEAITFPMVRQKGILYFHLKGTRSAIAEPITAATLKYGENTVNVTVNNGTALNEADGHKFWFCLPEGNYNSIQFSAETENYKFEINTKAGQTLSIAKGKLAKIVGTVSATNYTFKGEQPSFGPGVFDSCDYSPFVVGNNVSGGVSLCEGKVGKAYGFTTTIEEASLIGPMYITRGTALETPAGITLENGVLSFYVYTDNVIDLAASANRQFIVELTTSGQPDKEECQWMLWEGGNGSTAVKSLPAGVWTKLELNLADAVKTGTVDLSKGFNFFRIFAQSNTVAGTYNIKVDEIKLEKKTNYNKDGIAAFTSYPKDQNGNTVSGLRFNNTHPVFSADKKTAYVSSTVGHIVAVDLTEGSIKWVYTPSTTSGCATICVNPITGDIYGTNKATLTYAVTPEGQQKWVHTGYKVWGSSFAVSTDGTVVFGVGGNNRGIIALSAENGSTLYEMTQAKDGGNFYTNNAQIVVFDDDTNYDYIANQGNELISVIRHNKSTHAMEVLNYVKAQSKKTDNSGVSNHAALDITSAAVSPDKKFVYFLGGSVALTYCEIFAIDVTNAKTATSVQSGSTRLPIKYDIVQKTVQKAVSGLVFDKNGNAYLTAAKYVKKVAEADLRNGGEITAAWTSTIPSIDDNSFNFMCPSVAESGNVYFSCVKGTPGAVYMANSSANATKICDPGVNNTSFQGVFAMTDGYAVVGNAGGLYVKKLDETIAPNTWGYFGGDPCGSKNANLVYGNN